MLLRSWVESARAADPRRLGLGRARRARRAALLALGHRRARRRGRPGWLGRAGRRHARASTARRSSSGCCPTCDSLAQPVVLVIDDLHELRSEEALRVARAVPDASCPPQLRVVLATREDPALGLHRAAARRAADRDPRPTICASRWRRRAALLDASGITLSDAAVALLHERTEGWAAGLRLAAISLAGHPDPERFVAEFSGSERTVAGYLLAEVLERQPPEVRDLLLRTSVLERVSGPLADALTGGTGSEADPAEPRGRERVRHLARRRADVVSLPPPVRRSAARSSCGGPSPAIDRLAAPRGGAVVRASTGYVGRGDPPRAGGARLAARRAPARRQLRGPGVRRPQGDAARAAGRLPGRRGRGRSRAGARLRHRRACTTACSTRARPTSPSPSGWPRRCRRAPAALRPAAGQRTAVAGVPARRPRRGAGGDARPRSARRRDTPGASAATIAPRR